jgi:hypothetical protein
VGWRPAERYGETFTTHPTKIKSPGMTEAIIENGRVNFIMPTIPDIAALQLAARSYTYG